MNVMDELPWLASHWEHLDAYARAGRLPQALLVVGASGIGKMTLATAFAKRLLCREPGGYACGKCPACLLFEAQTHPDFLPIGPAEAGKSITVDAIRGLIAKLALKPQYGRARVVIIAPADQMNINAANSLLKTLEEPDEHTLMILLTDRPSAMPATILSRCQRMDMSTPPRELALAWLVARIGASDADALIGLAQGAPLRALALAEQNMLVRRREIFADWRRVGERSEPPVPTAERWSSVPVEDLLTWMSSWTMDLIRLGSAGKAGALDNPDLVDGLQALARRLHLKAAFAFFDQVNAARRAVSGQANRQLVIEELLIVWSRT